MKLSIITINYNNREGLQRTIDSVICQTWRDFEWIIIDGGSTDGSKELIEHYQDHFSYWCSEPDKGVYNAMNKGVAHASGEYVNFMNSGDCFFDTSVLDKICSLNNNSDIIVGLVERADNHKLLRRVNPDVFEQLYLFTLSHQGAFIKRELLERYPYDEKLKIVSDWKFWLETIIFNNASLCQTDILVAVQNMNGLSQNDEMTNRERGMVLEQFFPSLIKNELDRHYRIIYSPLYKNLEFLKKYHIIYVFIRKLISFFVITINKIYRFL